MEWDWVSTVVVAVVGVAATLLGTGSTHRHAERQAADAHQRERQEMRRQERLKEYADAMAHAFAEERRLDAVWATSEGGPYNISPVRPGGALLLAPMDAVGARLHLLADDDVRSAWLAFEAAWDSYHWWMANEASSDPDEHAPDGLEDALREAIGTLKTACRRALE